MEVIKIDTFVDVKNQQAHVDIEKDIQGQQNGLFTFILRINNGKITDYSVLKTSDARKYFRLAKVTIQELSSTRRPVPGDQGDPIRPDNI